MIAGGTHNSTILLQHAPPTEGERPRDLENLPEFFAQLDAKQALAVMVPAVIEAAFDYRGRFTGSRTGLAMALAAARDVIRGDKVTLRSPPGIRGERVGCKPGPGRTPGERVMGVTVRRLDEARATLESATARGEAVLRRVFPRHQQRAEVSKLIRAGVIAGYTLRAGSGKGSAHIVARVAA